MHGHDWRVFQWPHKLTHSGAALFMLKCLLGVIKLSKSARAGKGRHVYVRAWPRPSRSAWAETLQTHGFPVQT